MIVLDEVKEGLYTQKLYHVCEEASGSTVALFGYMDMAREYCDWKLSQGCRVFIRSAKY